MSVAIATQGLRKVYDPPSGRPGRRRSATMGPVAPAAAQAPRSGGPIVALDSLDFTVTPGTFVGLLGPNGAGKTTTIGMLTTRIRPTAGTAQVGGADIVQDPVGVRQRIGVVPQRPNPDRGLTVLENLVFHAAYFGIPERESEAKAVGLLGMFGIGDRAQAGVDQLSGGQQQRLMIARAMIHDPQVVFLDEPTVGLDPQARLALWDILRGLREAGRTVVMTTHYMEEADRLCDRVAIIDRGRLLAHDTPERLKAQAPGGTLIELHLDGDAAPLTERAAATPGVLRATAQDQILRAYSDRGGEVIPSLIADAGALGRTVRDIRLFPPSLETLFISLTGRTIE